MAVIIQKSDIRFDPRGDSIEFEEFERNEYVSRFLGVFNADLTETEICAQAYEIHVEIRAKHDLYIAVADRLGSRFKSALHWYAECRGQFRPRPNLKGLSEL